MKPYRDTFGNPLSKKDIRLAIQYAVTTDQISSIKLNRNTGLGLGKSKKILELLQDAIVISTSKNGVHTVTLKGPKQYDAAVNAALRQLKKGRS